MRSLTFISSKLRRSTHLPSFRRLSTLLSNKSKSRQRFNGYSLRFFAEKTINVPALGDSITEGVIVEWQKEEGDYCFTDDVICVLETDKVSVDVRSEAGGKLTKQLGKVDDVLEVGAPLYSYDPDAPAPEGGKPDAAPVADTPPAAAPAAAAPAATPAAAAPAAATPAPSPPKKAAAPTPTPPAPIVAGSREERRTPMSRMRLRISERLKEAQNTAAILTTFNEIDMSNLMSLRSRVQDDFTAKHGTKLGFMGVFVKASCAALRDQPAVNALIDGKDIVYRDYCDVSVAVASPNGLVVPVVRNAESMSVAEVERTIAMFGKKAKEGSIALEDMAGGTFTISNGGVFKSLMGTPIINPPQSAILGMHGIFERPVAVNGQVEIRPMMYVALSYDHRIIDGREAVLFLRKIKDCVEDPVRLALDC